MFRQSIFAIAAAFAFAGAAGAADSTWVANTANGGAADTDTFTKAFNPNGANVTFSGTEADLGSIMLGSAAKYKVSFTFLGAEAGFNNQITVNMGGDSMSNKGSVGNELTSTGVAGGSLLDFTFVDQKGRSTANGDAFGTKPVISWGWLEGATSTLSSGFDYIVGLNDGAGGTSRDYDDMLVGITITAVPEPESLALMLAGLGCVAVVGRRRKQA